MTLLVLVLCGWAVLRPAAPAHQAVAPAGVDRAETEALELLRDWDSRRAQAWAEGDVVALRSLYVTGSRSAEVDVEMLRQYVARGLVVEGLSTQVLSLSLLRDPAPDSLRVEVTDRVSGGHVVTRDGAQQALPVDEASTRVVTLRRVEGTWLVAEARDVPG
jgi:hypothetical protein